MIVLPVHETDERKNGERESKREKRWGGEGERQRGEDERDGEEKVRGREEREGWRGNRNCDQVNRWETRDKEIFPVTNVPVTSTRHILDFLSIIHVCQGTRTSFCSPQ